MGYIAALILALAVVPILAMLYMDVLQIKHEAKQSLEKVEKLRRQIEQERKDARTDRPK